MVHCFNWFELVSGRKQPFCSLYSSLVAPKFMDRLWFKTEVGPTSRSQTFKLTGSGDLVDLGSDFSYEELTKVTDYTKFLCNLVQV